MPHLFVFGYGYSARRVGLSLASDPAEAWRITGTRRSHEGVLELGALGVEAVRFGPSGLDSHGLEALRTATHLLISVPPDEVGDPVLRLAIGGIRACVRLDWVGYLSTTGVYGDHDGAWVDESTPTEPVFPRTARRLAAEQAWSDLCADLGVPLQILRLTGVYGPGRSVVDRLRAGTARRIVRPGHYFNRIHVDDVAGAVTAGVRRCDQQGVFNIADDLPSPAEEPILYAAQALGITPPPVISLDEAGLTEMGRSFYLQSRRVRNDRAKAMLGWTLRYPTFREGLAAILEGRD